jgi:hypothetical protein
MAAVFPLRAWLYTTIVATSVCAVLLLLILKLLSTLPFSQNLSRRFLSTCRAFLKFCTHPVHHNWSSFRYCSIHTQTEQQAKRLIFACSNAAECMGASELVFRAQITILVRQNLIHQLDYVCCKSITIFIMRCRSRSCKSKEDLLPYNLWQYLVINNQQKLPGPQLMTQLHERIYMDSTICVIFA